MWMPSFKRVPVACVRFARSDPARSTKCSFEHLRSPAACWMESQCCALLNPKSQVKSTLSLLSRGYDCTQALRLRSLVLAGT